VSERERERKRKNALCHKERVICRKIEQTLEICEERYKVNECNKKKKEKRQVRIRKRDKSRKKVNGRRKQMENTIAEREKEKEQKHYSCSIGERGRKKIEITKKEK
jgi:hypothetical protein